MPSTMVVLKHKIQVFHGDNLQASLFRIKHPDCVLYSEDGKNFRIHKEILCQTRFMQNILSSAKNFCCENIEVFCPCSSEDLHYIVKFLYSGKIHSNEDIDITKIKTILTKIFGYSEELYFDCTMNEEKNQKKYQRLDSASLFEDKDTIIKTNSEEMNDTYTEEETNNIKQYQDEKNLENCESNQQNYKVMKTDITDMNSNRCQKLDSDNSFGDKDPLNVANSEEIIDMDTVEETDVFKLYQEKYESKQKSSKVRKPNILKRKSKKHQKLDSANSEEIADMDTTEEPTNIDQYLIENDTKIQNESKDLILKNNRTNTPSSTISICQNEMYSCEICTHTFKYKKGLKEHVLETHEEKRKFTCHICQGIWIYLVCFYLCFW